MNILYIGSSLFTTTTGGEISARLLISKLSLTHNIVTICLDKEKNDIIKKNIHYKMLKLPKILNQKLFPHHLKGYLVDVCMQKKIKNFLITYTPDIVICQNIPINPAILPKKVRNIFFIRSCEDFSLWEGWYGPFGKIHKLYNNMFFKIRNNRGIKTLKNVDLLISNSFFMKKYLKKMGIKSEVIYPFIRLDDYKYKTINNHHLVKKKYITFIKPVYEKGVEIALRIAKALPKREFLFVGESTRMSRKILKEINELKNVKFIEWVQDARNIYQQASVIIMPSIWEEAFGRIPIEAGINGIPIIASKRGGIPESVGKEGIIIEDFQNINNWIKSLEKLDNRDEYYKYSLFAKKNAQNFDFEITYEEFKRKVREKLKIEL